MNCRILSIVVAASIALPAQAGCSGAKIAPVDTTLAATVEEPNALYSELLAAHVTDGQVDYENLKDDPRLSRYIAWLMATDPASLPDESSRLAFWINAYNAWTLKVVVDNLPLKSIQDLHVGGKLVGYATKQTVWDQKFVVVGGEEYSLNNIEHDIIRRRFNEPRIHFALVCAATSCPPLRREAYAGTRLDAQLTDQGRAFFADDTKNRFDSSARIAYLSKILDWYGGDFGTSPADRLHAIASMFPPQIRESVMSDADPWSIKYTDYDWSLNATPGGMAR